MESPRERNKATNCLGDEYVFEWCAIEKKRPADLSIVKRLGGFSCCKDTTFFITVKYFVKKIVKKTTNKAKPKYDNRLRDPY